MTSDIDIKRLIPQREPILMVDKLLSAESDTAVSQLTVRADNYFAQEDGTLAETGIIEHIAQSASAFAGYKAMTIGAEEPPVGYIGEVKKFRCLRCPHIGETLQTTITFGAEVEGVTILTGETYAGNEMVASTQMKIYVQVKGSAL